MSASSSIAKRVSQLTKKTYPKHRYVKSRRGLPRLSNVLPVPAEAAPLSHVSDLSSRRRLHSDRLAGTSTRFHVPLGANADQIAFGIFRRICALLLSLFLAIHKVCLQDSAFTRTQILSKSALDDFIIVCSERPERDDICFYSLYHGRGLLSCLFCAHFGRSRRAGKPCRRARKGVLQKAKNAAECLDNIGEGLRPTPVLYSTESKCITASAVGQKRLFCRT